MTARIFKFTIAIIAICTILSNFAFAEKFIREISIQYKGEKVNQTKFDNIKISHRGFNSNYILSKVGGDTLELDYNGLPEEIKSFDSSCNFYRYLHQVIDSLPRKDSIGKFIDQKIIDKDTILITINWKGSDMRDLFFNFKAESK